MKWYWIAIIVVVSGLAGYMIAGGKFGSTTTPPAAAAKA